MELEWSVNLAIRKETLDMFSNKNKNMRLKKVAFLLSLMIPVYTAQVSFGKAVNNSRTSTKAASQSSSRKINSDLKSFIEVFSNTVITTQKSNLSEKDLKDALTGIAKTYMDANSLCPFLFGSYYYKKIDKNTRKELKEDGIIASMVAQCILKLLPHKKAVTTVVKSTIKTSSKIWLVKTEYKVNKQSSVQTYNATFSVKESGKNKFLISNVEAEGIDGRKLLRDEVQNMIKTNGLDKTLEKLRQDHK